LAVSPSADQLQQQQQRLSQQHQHQQRKIGVGALDGARLANNNNISVGLCVSDLSDMSSESDSEFPQPRSNGESEGNVDKINEKNLNSNSKLSFVMLG
jgi:hypothetical protein